MEYRKHQFPRPFFGEPRLTREERLLTPELRRRLDETVGAYDDGEGTRLARTGRTAAKVAVASLLAAVAVAAIAVVLHRHLDAGHPAPPAPGKPVSVHIVPPAR